MKHILLILSSFLLLASCEDVIDLDLPEGAQRIIINGRITDRVKTRVDIHVTADYLSSAPNPAISDAQVKLFENGIEVATLQESDTAKGYYTSPFKGTLGNRYYIQVTIPEGHSYFPGTTWLSVPEEMKRIAPLDSSYFKYQPKQPFIDEGYYAYAMFTDPVGQGDNYRFRVWKNDSLYNTAFDLTAVRDEFFDGQSFNDSLLPAIQFGYAEALGDTFTLEMSSCTAEYISFLELLSEQTTQVGSTFDPPPSPIIGNIYNAASREQYGLGYCNASKLSFIQVEMVE